jgi:hypothetical protein
LAVTDPTAEAAGSLVNHGRLPAYFEQLAATVEEIGRLRWLRDQICPQCQRAKAT